MKERLQINGILETYRRASRSVCFGTIPPRAKKFGVSIKHRQNLFRQQSRMTYHAPRGGFEPHRTLHVRGDSVPRTRSYLARIKIHKDFSFLKRTPFLRHPDRLARNSVDGGKIIHFVDRGLIRSLKFPTFWFEATPQGLFMLNIAFGQSKYFEKTTLQIKLILNNTKQNNQKQ